MNLKEIADRLLEVSSINWNVALRDTSFNDFETIEDLAEYL